MNARTPSSSRASWRRLSRTLRRHPVGTASLVALMVILTCALLAEFIAPYPPGRQAYTAVLQAPSAEHLLGTDEFGRDILSRIIHGGRVSMLVGLSSVFFAVLAGSSIGLGAGYFGGPLDDVLMRTMDALYSFPAIILALAITAVLGPGIVNMIVALGIVYTPIFARLTRGSVLSVRTRDYVSAAIALGAPHKRIILYHITPNILAPILVQASLSVSFAVITEASLSFLGVGVQPPTPSWGAMLRSGYGYLELAPWYSIYPGVAIFITVLSLNLLGDALRDYLDPKLQRR